MIIQTFFFSCLVASVIGHFCGSIFNTKLFVFWKKLYWICKLQSGWICLNFCFKLTWTFCVNGGIQALICMLYSVCSVICLYCACVCEDQRLTLGLVCISSPLASSLFFKHFFFNFTFFETDSFAEAGVEEFG